VELYERIFLFSSVNSDAELLVHTDSVCSRSSSLLFRILLITNCLYCVFFLLYSEREVRRRTLGGWYRSEVSRTPAINKNININIYKSLYYFMLFGVQYTDYILISCSEESG
jgi:hypothetical protein